MTAIQFGTDGWRAVIGDEFTFANVRRVAQATADYWNSPVGQASCLSKSPNSAVGQASCPSHPLRSVIVGYDNRFLSETYARLVCEVLAANGFTALYPPTPSPTPAISYAVRAENLGGAVMITASHNPPQFNGYKLKAAYAGPAEPAICAAIEARVGQSPVRLVNFDDAVKTGAIKPHDPQPAHGAALRQRVNWRVIRRAQLRVVVDSMHGCGGRLLEAMLAGSAVRPQTIRADRDPLFGGTNPEPIAANLGPLGAAVTASRADVGLATDGDADRIGVVDERGRYVSIQLVFALLLLHLLRNRPRATVLPARLVVKSSNSTVLIDRIGAAHGLAVAEVPVGFKHICAKMREAEVLIGGEESGGIGFHNYIPERDGLLACLTFLEMLAVTGQSVSELAADLQREFGRSAYDRIDLPYPLDRRADLIARLRQAPPRELLGVPLVETKTFDGVKYEARDGSWLMFRASGTEPIIRIYSEAATATRVRQLLAYGQRLALRESR